MKSLKIKKRKNELLYVLYLKCMSLWHYATKVPPLHHLFVLNLQVGNRTLLLSTLLDSIVFQNI